MNDMRKFMKLAESAFGWDCKECGSPEIPDEKDYCPVCGSSWEEQNGGLEEGGDFPACAECGNVNDDNPGEAMCKTCADWYVGEDCDETPEQGEDGECSPFTHTKDNVDMVREEGDEDYHEEWVQNLMKMGKQKLWIEYNRTLEDDDYPGRTDELQHMEDALSRLGIDIAEGVMDEDFLIPPKDAKYDAEVEEEGEDDDWDKPEMELDRQTDYNAPSRYDGDDSFDFDMDEDGPMTDPSKNYHVGRAFASGEIEEQGPGDDEFDADPDAMVDVGDDEDYEEFDFDDEFDKMMGNTYRFDEEDVMEMKELRKLAGLKESWRDPEGVNWKDADLVSPDEYDDEGRRLITKADVAANGVIHGDDSEIVAAGGGTSSSRGNGNWVEIKPMERMVDFSKWWEFDKKQLMSQFYWGRRQLPPEGEAYDEAWEQLKASLQKKYPAPEFKLSTELSEKEGDTCSRCRKGTMEVGDTFFGPQQRCNHCGFQRAVKESTDSKDDYVAFTFDDEKAYFLVADECGEMMDFGVRDECLIPDQWVDQVLVLLKDHGFEKGKDFSVAGMEEDLQNGYNDQHSVDHEYDDRFPKGATSSPARELGPAGAKHGDNPMRTPMASVDKQEDDIYESYRKQYRRFRRSK